MHHTLAEFVLWGTKRTMTLLTHVVLLAELVLWENIAETDLPDYSTRICTLRYQRIGIRTNPTNVTEVKRRRASNPLVIFSSAIPVEKKKIVIMCQTTMILCSHNNQAKKDMVIVWHFIFGYPFLQLNKR